MTDKEIIIDGVDVSGCEYMLNNKIKGKQHCPAKAMPYAKETSCICRKSIDTPYNFCKHNPNCHYKQLKRLEQGNEELKALISQRDASVTAQAEIILKLKAENDRLKREFEIENLTDNTTGETIYRSNKVNKLKEELATYGATGVCEVCSDKANKLADKYLGCLQEIKEIAEQILNKNEFIYMNYRDVRQIIRLITKAEEE